MALASEAGELLDIFRWLTEEEASAIGKDSREHALAEDEIADVFIYLLRLADRLGVNLEKAVEAKIRKNEERYPVELSRGNATKYNRRKE
jgi:NTP pyrophosphatase (non-canonical NTP hydrolase)